MSLWQDMDRPLDEVENVYMRRAVFLLMTPVVLVLSFILYALVREPGYWEALKRNWVYPCWYGEKPK